MTSPLELLPTLRELHRESLAELVRARSVPSRGISGLIDLAEWLVAPDHIEQCIAEMPWRMLRRLECRDPKALEHARKLALATSDGTLITEAADAVAAQLAADGGRAGEALTSDASHLTQLDASAAEHSFAALQLAAELLHRVDTGAVAARRDRKGLRMAGVDVRRLAAQLESHADTISALASLMIRADLMADRREVLAPTEHGREWLLSGVHERWQHLADAWMRALTAGERALILHGTPSQECRELTHALGVTTTSSEQRKLVSSVGAHVLDDDLAAAANILDELFPHSVDRVYFQADGAVIALGPLAPHVDEQLRARAEIEQSGIATQFRITRQSLTRALAAGDTPESLRDALAAMSLSDLPQPIDYLIADVAEHYGEIRVRPHDDPFARGCRVLSNDPQLLDALEVDRSLAALGLHRHGPHELTARVHAEGVYHTLLEAKMPVAAEHLDGSPWRMDVPGTATISETPLTASQERLVETLLDDVEREEARDGDEAWLRRQLDRARRDKRAVQVEVQLGAEIRALTLIPTSVTGPRFRGRDVEADVERTIPFSAIAAVHDDTE